MLIFGVYHFTDKAGSRNILQKQAVSGFLEWTYGVYWTYFCTHQWRQVASLHSMPLSWAADVAHFAQDHSCHNSPPMWPSMNCWRSDRTLGVWCQESRNMRIFVQIPDLKNFEELFGLHWTTMTPEDQHTESAGAILPVSVLRVPTQFHSAPSRSISTCLWSCDRTTTMSLCPNPVC